jgi:tetratricopeptide (TPR) repeat protein
MAHCYEQMGDFDASVKCYSDYIDENPYSFTAWYNLGNAYSRDEDYEKAIWAYDYCLLINEKFGPVYFNLGNAYLGLDKYTKAIEAFGKCIDLDGDDPIALCYMGECHEQLNELDLAKHYYNRSLELAPNLPDAWLGLGIVKDLEGDTREGLTLILKANELDPDNPGIYHVLAGAYEKLEERETANDYYEMSLNLDPDDEECLINYTNFIKVESVLDALKFIEAHEKVTAENEIIPILKVSVLYELGRKDESLALFKECLEENREKALELFDINPSLKNVSEFVLLGDQ